MLRIQQRSRTVQFQRKYALQGVKAAYIQNFPGLAEASKQAVMSLPAPQPPSTDTPAPNTAMLLQVHQPYTGKQESSWLRQRWLTSIAYSTTPQLQMSAAFPS